jgi:hypothetical protein
MRLELRRTSIDPLEDGNLPDLPPFLSDPSFLDIAKGGNLLVGETAVFSFGQELFAWPFGDQSALDLGDGGELNEKPAIDPCKLPDVLHGKFLGVSFEEKLESFGLSHTKLALELLHLDFLGPWHQNSDTLIGPLERANGLEERFPKMTPQRHDLSD